MTASTIRRARRGQTKHRSVKTANKSDSGAISCHLREFKIVQYRGISGLSIPNLTRVNLFTGYNGIGKTALLEAIWLFGGRHNATLFWNNNVLRTSDPVVDPIAHLSTDEIHFFGVEVDQPISYRVYFQRTHNTPSPTAQRSLESKDEVPIIGRLVTEINSRSMRKPEVLHQTPGGIVTCRAGSVGNRAQGILVTTGQHPDTGIENLKRYSELVRAGHKQALIEAVRLMFGDCEEIEILSNDVGKSYFSIARKDGYQLPIRSLGGGAVKLFGLYVNLFTARNGCVLLDEMENGVHFSVSQDLWRHVRQWTHDWNVQIHATTHSAEFIEAAIDAYIDHADELSIHHLNADKKSNSIFTRTYTGSSLLGARDLNLEVR